MTAAPEDYVSITPSFQESQHIQFDHYRRIQDESVGLAIDLARSCRWLGQLLS